jgi:predicted transcriptional regulator
MMCLINLTNITYRQPEVSLGMAIKRAWTVGAEDKKYGQYASVC